MKSTQHTANPAAQPRRLNINIGGVAHQLVAENEKFWQKVDANRWEPDTLTLLDRCLRADSVYVDVGAWIGPTVLFAAPRCRIVYGIEPDPVAYEQLLANLRLNHIQNARLFHGALCAQNGVAQVVNEKGFGDSVTRVGESTRGDRAEVLAMTPTRFTEFWGIEKIDLLKVDIEGGEFDLIPALIELTARTKPIIHLSLHAPNFPPPLRQSKLQQAAKLARLYRHCYDKHLTTLPVEQIASEHFAQKFDAVVLSDEAL